MAMRIAVIASAVGASLASGPGGDPIPDPDTCELASAGTVDAVEIGDDDESSFVPLDDGASADFAVGGQGTDMFPMRIRIAGPDLPECLAQSTELVYDGTVIASTNEPLQTYADAAGTRATHAMFVIIFDVAPSPGESFTVSTTVGTITETRSLMRAQATSL